MHVRECPRTLTNQKHEGPKLEPHVEKENHLILKKTNTFDRLKENFTSKQPYHHFFLAHLVLVFQYYLPS